MVHGGNLLRSENGGFATYECRTVYDTELADNQWKRAEQSMACRTRENQLLTKQRDEAHERIKRLEGALTWYEYTVSNCYCHGSEGDAARDALRKDQGRKAKEAKL
jgi:DNA-binding transcriptional MerR regulator